MFPSLTLNQTPSDHINIFLTLQNNTDVNGSLQSFLRQTSLLKILFSVKHNTKPLKSSILSVKRKKYHWRRVSFFETSISFPALSAFKLTASHMSHLPLTLQWQRVRNSNELAIWRVSELLNDHVNEDQANNLIRDSTTQKR